MPVLNVLGEKSLPQAIKDGLLAYCPTMDLIALATADEQVHVFRINGQRVFGVSNRNSERKITQLQWKPNGRLLAVAFSDLSLLLINAYTGKTVHRFQLPSIPGEQPTCLGWGVSFTNYAAVEALLRGIKETVTIDDILSRGMQGILSDFPLDLPSELSNLDVETVLPKLSTLPLGSKDEELFSTRASIDSLFHTRNKEANESTDVLLVGSSNGSLHLRIYDSFDLGMFDADRRDPRSDIIGYASHPSSSTHALLFSGSQERKDEVILVPLDLRMITETGGYLSLIASKSTQLQNLLRYIIATQFQIYKEFATSQELPKRFIRNIEEALQEKKGCSFATAAYHLAATGDCYECMKEWLVDELRDQGQKRWDKAVTTGYENVRRLTHENLLPALQRFSVVVSRLRGLSKFEDSRVALGLETQELDQIFDTISCLQLFCHTILICAGLELRQFTAFSSWLCQQIETQATDPLSTAAEENAEKEEMPDYQSVFDYIQGALQGSKLLDYFDMVSIMDRPVVSWQAADDEQMYIKFKLEVRKIRDGVRLEQPFPGLAVVVARLERQCKVVFRRTAATQKKKIRLAQPVPIGKRANHFDMVMVPSGTADESYTMSVYVVTGQNDPNPSVLAHRVTWKIVSGMSLLDAQGLAQIVLPKDFRLHDLKIIDDQSLVVLVSSKLSSYLIYIPYQDKDQGGAIDYGKPSESTQGGFPTTQATLDLSDFSVLKQYIAHEFPSEARAWMPGSIEVNGRKGRRAICVMSKDRLSFSLYDLDSSHDKEEEEEAETGKAAEDVADGDEMLL